MNGIPQPGKAYEKRSTKPPLPPEEFIAGKVIARPTFTIISGTPFQSGAHRSGDPQLRAGAETLRRMMRIHGTTRIANLQVVDKIETMPALYFTADGSTVLAVGAVRTPGAHG